jgi:chemotaxis protein histidine kinase CheA
MSTPNDPLNFFTLEASECIERMDVILHAAGASGSGPAADDFVRAARTLRGAATMHRLSAIADLAAALERAGRALRAGELRWTAPLSAALVAAVDDLKILVHKVRSWSATEDARSARRVADLARYLPAGADAVGATATAAGAGADQYFASETTEIALALDAFAARPSGRGTLAGALARVRTLRGVAAVADRPPLPEVLDTVERVGRSAELDAGTPGAASLVLLTAAAQLLRRIAGELRAGNVRNAAASTEYQRFVTAGAEVTRATEAADRIIPIDELFPDDGTDGVIDAAPSPPTTPAERFRLEVVSQAEHLRALLAGGAAPVLRSALRAVRSAAQSFGERDLAAVIGRFADGDDAQPFEAGELAAIAAIADVLADPTADLRHLGERVAGIKERDVELDANALEAEIALGLSDTATVPDGIETELSLERLLGLRGPDAGFGAPSPGRERTSTPTGRALHAFLQNGISEIEREPIAFDGADAEPEDDGSGVVPIDALLYRGRAALDRARVVRDEIRAAEQAGATPRPESLAELLDLIDLAATA